MKGKISMTVSTSAFTMPNGINIKNPKALFNYINSIAWTFMSTDWDLQDPCMVFTTGGKPEVESYDSTRIIDLTMAGIEVFIFDSVEDAYDCIKSLYLATERRA